MLRNPPFLLLWVPSNKQITTPCFITFTDAELVCSGSCHVRVGLPRWVFFFLEFFSIMLSHGSRAIVKLGDVGSLPRHCNRKSDVQHMQGNSGLVHDERRGWIMKTSSLFTSMPPTSAAGSLQKSLTLWLGCVAAGLCSEKYFWKTKS